MERLISLLHWVPAIAWASLIFYLSGQSRPLGASLIPDTLGHFIAYAVLGATLVRGKTRGWKEALSGRQALFLWLLACAYAISDEYHQSFIPGRDPSVKDLVVDFTGAGVAIWFLKNWRRVLPR